MLDYIPIKLKIMWLIFVVLCIAPMILAMYGEKREKRRKLDS